MRDSWQVIPFFVNFDECKKKCHVYLQRHIRHFSIILRSSEHIDNARKSFCVMLSIGFNTQQSAWFSHSYQQGLLQENALPSTWTALVSGLSTWLSWIKIKETDGTSLKEMDTWMIPRAYSLHSSEKDAQRLDKLPMWWKAYHTQSPNSPCGHPGGLPHSGSWTFYSFNPTV